jgi:CRP-like cAMP-binding protein
VNGKLLAELGPGAVLGERAILEGGLRTSTVSAVTRVRVAVAPAAAIDRDRLAELAKSHRREESTQGSGNSKDAGPVDDTTAAPAPPA